MDYEDISKDIRKKVLGMVYNSKTSHLGCSFSIIDILAVLYFKILSLDPKNPWGESRDRFILSKGHGVAALYAILAKRGFFPEEILNTYCQDGGKLPGHSTRGSLPGIEASTGALGHGLSMGCGMARAAKDDNLPHKIFVLLSDGECDSGFTWEAALFASHHQLDNLVAIIDYNKIQGFGRTNEVINLEPFVDKWAAFGWEVKEINGHNHSEIEKAFAKLPFEKNKPSIVIANTVKGKGVSFMEDQILWHYRCPDNEEFERALKELDTI